MIYSGHLGAFGSVLSPKASMYLFITSKHNPYFGPPSPAQAQCQLSWSVGAGMPLAPKYALVAWQTQVLYMAQEPVAENLQAAHASSIDLKAPSSAVSGVSPSGVGGAPGRGLLSSSSGGPPWTRKEVCATQGDRVRESTNATTAMFMMLCSIEDSSVS